jgi:hypothetical protein
MATHVEAFINHGEWKMICPKCGQITKTQIGQNKYICLPCWPVIMATALQEFITNTNGIIQKILRPVPDLEARDAAEHAARQAGEEYNIDFPQHAAEIEASIATETNVNWKNWYPASFNNAEFKAKHPTAHAYGQTLAEIEDERINHVKVVKQ